MAAATTVAASAKSDSTTGLKRVSIHPSSSNTTTHVNHADGHEPTHETPVSNLKNNNSSLKKKSKEQHLLTCNKSASLTRPSLTSSMRPDSKCDHCGHVKCINRREHLRLSSLGDGRKLNRNNSCSSDRGVRYRSRSASSTSYVSRSLENHESQSVTSLDANDLTCLRGGEPNIRDRIEYAQIFLEAIGNASTQTNSNSSRFVS